VARQIAGVVQTLIHRTPFKITLCIPPNQKGEVEPELKEMTERPLNQAHIVIATRGSLANMVRKQTPMFARVEMLVVDEVDQVLIERPNQGKGKAVLCKEALDIKRYHCPSVIISEFNVLHSVMVFLFDSCFETIYFLDIQCVCQPEADFVLQCHLRT
jgi:hypothetical protein